MGSFGLALSPTVGGARIPAPTAFGDLPMRVPISRGLEPARSGAGDEEALPVLMGSLVNKPRTRERSRAHFADGDDQELLAMAARDAFLSRMRRVRGRDAPICI